MNERQISVPSDAAQLSALSRFLQDFWTEFNLPAAAALTFELALEEVFMNVVMHASRGGSVSQVVVSLALGADGATMVVEDSGPAFDPLSLPAPDIAASLGDRPIGGLGVFLVRRLMDAVSYHRVGACNRLSMSKRIGVA